MGPGERRLLFPLICYVGTHQIRCAPSLAIWLLILNPLLSHFGINEAIGCLHAKFTLTDQDLRGSPIVSTSQLMR